MAKHKGIFKSRFFCTSCGKEGIPIARFAEQQREPGHLKRLYCLYCKKEVNHVEIRPFGSYLLENFKEEYNLGRFVNGQRTAIKDLTSCKNLECPYNKDGKCWNSNHSFTDCQINRK